MSTVNGVQSGNYFINTKGVDLGVTGPKKFDTSTSDFAAFQRLTVNRDKTLGSLVLDDKGGLKCVGHHVFRPLNLFDHTVGRKEADALRARFEEVLNDELEVCFGTLKYIGGADNNQLDKPELQKKMEDIKMYFRKAIYAGSGSPSHWEFKRSDIADIINNVQFLKWNLSIDRLANARVEDLCQLGSRDKTKLETARQGVGKFQVDSAAVRNLARKSQADALRVKVASKLDVITPEKVKDERLIAAANKFLLGLQTDMKRVGVEDFAKKYPGLSFSRQNGKFELKLADNANSEDVFSSVKKLVLEQSKLEKSLPDSMDSNSGKLRKASSFVDGFVDAVGSTVQNDKAVENRQETEGKVKDSLTLLGNKLNAMIALRKDFSEDKKAELKDHFAQKMAMLSKRLIKERVYPQGYLFKSVDDTKAEMKVVDDILDKLDATMSVDGMSHMSVYELSRILTCETKANRFRCGQQNAEAAKTELIDNLIPKCSQKLLLDVGKVLSKAVFKKESIDTGDDVGGYNLVLKEFGIKNLVLNEKYELIPDKGTNDWVEDLKTLVGKLVSEDRGLLKAAGLDDMLCPADIADALNEFKGTLAEELQKEEFEKQEALKQNESASGKNGGGEVELVELGGDGKMKDPPVEEQPVEEQPKEAGDVNQTNESGEVEMVNLPKEDEEIPTDFTWKDFGSRAEKGGAYDLSMPPDVRFGKFIEEVGKNCKGKGYGEVIGYVFDQFVLKNPGFVHQSEAEFNADKGLQAFVNLHRRLKEMIENADTKTSAGVLQLRASIETLYGGSVDAYFDYISVLNDLFGNQIELNTMDVEKAREHIELFV